VKRFRSVDEISGSVDIIVLEIAVGKEHHIDVENKVLQRCKHFGYRLPESRAGALFSLQEILSQGQSLFVI
jgi:hypothetical protein